MIATTRREVIGSALAGGLAATIPGIAQAKGAGAMAAWFYDARDLTSATEADRFRQAGALVVDGRDVDLGHAWRKLVPAALASGGAVAGITPWSDFLVAEISGRELGLKVSLRETLPNGLNRWELRR